MVDSDRGERAVISLPTLAVQGLNYSTIGPSWMEMVPDFQCLLH